MHILGVGTIAKPERRKPHSGQRAGDQTGAPQGLPERLGIGGQVALAGGGDGDEDDGMAAQIGLANGEQIIGRDGHARLGRS